ncbi:MAG: 2-oxo acid dehydrogenase subunit E2 [Clostridiales bacterium]|nr:2-oxo acid dehydrogenase subunit E2 [Clostridiales bacterium]
MAVPIIMPRQGQSVESCIISQWHKKKGDKVEIGDVLFTYETDKATFEEESKHSGILLDIFFEEDDDVPVLTNVCVIGEEGEDPSVFSPHAAPPAPEETKAEETQTPQEAPAEDVQVSEAAPEQTAVQEIEDKKIRISPRARNLAKDAGVDFTKATPTGPGGRIIVRDIETLIDEAPAAVTQTSKVVSAQPAVSALEDYEEVKPTNIRKVIAKAMHKSLAETAQLTLNSSFDAGNIMDFRKELKTKGEKYGVDGITLNDIVLYAVSRTLLNHKDLNAHFLGDSMHVYNTVNLGVAVDTPRGLMVPTIFNADRKSLYEISKESKELAAACQAGTINPDLLAGGTFTVTNLGTLRVESFTPVLNPPETGILGVNNIAEKVRSSKDGIELYPAMGLSLTFDHRAVDGAPAARFLKELAENLENFTLLLAR